MILIPVLFVATVIVGTIVAAVHDHNKSAGVLVGVVGVILLFVLAVALANNT